MEIICLLILIDLQIIYNHLQNLFDKIIVFQIDFYNFNNVIFIPPDQKAGGRFTFTKLETIAILDRRVQSPCQQNFFDLATKSQLSQAISYTFLDKHFLLIENMSSEASSSELFILLLFFDALRTPSFKNRTFPKNQPHFPLYFPQFSRRHVFVLHHFMQVLPSKT